MRRRRRRRRKEGRRKEERDSAEVNHKPTHRGSDFSLDIRQYLTKGALFNLFNKNDGKSSNILFFDSFLRPGRRLLLTPGMGMGGTVWDHLEIISGPF